MSAVAATKSEKLLTRTIVSKFWLPRSNNLYVSWSRTISFVLNKSSFYLNLLGLSFDVFLLVLCVQSSVFVFMCYLSVVSYVAVLSPPCKQGAFFFLTGSEKH